MPLAHARGPGHPDALCDTLAIALVEEYLRRDPEARMRLCVTGGRESLFVDGDLVSAADFDPAAILRRVLTEVDPTLTAEPFLTCEPVQANFLPKNASFEPWIVYGYATAETPDGLPPAQSAVRAFAQAVERFRSQSDGYLLGSDYDLFADDSARDLSMRFEHPATVLKEAVEVAMRSLLEKTLPSWSFRSLAAGSVSEAGLRRRSGVSGRLQAADLYSSHIPAHASGVGSPIRHPGNLGAWLARAEAQRLVKEGFGRGILLVLRWNPFETRPLIVSARNEKGEELSTKISAEMFDLSAVQTAFVQEGALMKRFREPWTAMSG